MSILKKLDALAARNDSLFEEARAFEKIADQGRLVKELLKIQWQLRAANAFLLAAKYDDVSWWKVSRKKVEIADIDEFCKSLFMAFLEFGIEKAQQLAPKDKLLRSKLAKAVGALDRDSLLPHVLAWHLAPRPNRYGTMLAKLCRFGREIEAAAFAALKMPEFDNENSGRFLLEAVVRADAQLSAFAMILLENDSKEKALGHAEKYAWIMAARLSQQNRDVISSLKKAHYYPAWINSTDIGAIVLKDQELLKHGATEREALEHRVRLLTDNLEESMAEAATWRKCHDALTRRQ